jgi:hypothetical protein
MAVEDGCAIAELLGRDWATTETRGRRPRSSPGDEGGDYGRAEGV